jgi:hypothetical protein
MRTRRERSSPNNLCIYKVKSNLRLIARNIYFPYIIIHFLFGGEKNQDAIKLHSNVINIRQKRKCCFFLVFCFVKYDIETDEKFNLRNIISCIQREFSLS